MVPILVWNILLQYIHVHCSGVLIGPNIRILEINRSQQSRKWAFIFLETIFQGIARDSVPITCHLHYNVNDIPRHLYKLYNTVV